jgi:glycosyltransferase involved in cell wall biosynthesis
MKISVVVPNLASNGALRSWIISQLLARHYDVEAIGLLKPGEEVLPWVRDYDWRKVPAGGVYESMRRLERAVTGDIVLAHGAGMWSFGAALLAKRRRRLPVILDMGEWETHQHLKFERRVPRALMIARNLVGPGWKNPHSFKYLYVLDHLVGLADERTVACSFLQRRYGGVVLHFATDTTKFDPARFDKMAVRRKWGVPTDATILFFGGNPQPMKGLEETLDAIDALADRVNARLVIAGRDETHPYTRKVMERSGGKAILLGPQPFHLMPELLAMADLVALPDSRTPKSMGYVPAKVYEAMAMMVPVIASDLSDMPEILEGCGYVIPADDSAALREKIVQVLLHPDEARELGRRARQRVIERYSWDAGAKVLQGVVEGVAARAGLARGALHVSPAPSKAA